MRKFTPDLLLLAGLLLLPLILFAPVTLGGKTLLYYLITSTIAHFALRNWHESAVKREN